MTRRTTLLVTLLLLAAAAPAGLGGLAAPDNQERPGGSVGRVIDSQGETLDGAVAVDRFRTRLAAAETPSERAAVVDAALNRSERRLATLDRRLGGLRTTRENGSLDRAAYDARVAPLVSRARSVGSVLDSARRAARDIDNGTLRAAGVTSDRFAEARADLTDILAADPGEFDGVDQGFYRRVASLVTTYNDDAGDRDLGVLGAHVNGERVTLRVVRPNGSDALLGFRTTEDGRIETLRAGPHPEATVRVRVEASTARRLLRAEDSDAAASEAFLDGEITVAGVGLVDRLRWAVAGIVLGIVQALLGLAGWLLSVIP